MLKILKFIWKFIILIPKRIVELSKTGKDVAAEAASTGQVWSSDKIANHRLKTCRDCDLLQDDGTCGVCTCYMTTKVKFKAAKCPEDKW